MLKLKVFIWIFFVYTFIKLKVIQQKNGTLFKHLLITKNIDSNTSNCRYTCTRHTSQFHQKPNLFGCPCVSQNFSIAAWRSEERGVGMVLLP